MKEFIRCKSLFNIVLILASPALVCAESVVVDNKDPGFSILKGTWNTGHGRHAHKHGYYWTTTVGIDESEPTAIAQWRPKFSASGFYRVSAWFVSGNNRSDNATFTVHHAGGSTPILVNQKNNGNQWFILGDFNFDAGSNGFVTLHNQANKTVVIADAVRFQVYTPEPVNLIMEVYPPNAGSVSPGKGAAVIHDQDTEVEISAKPADGYRFHHWQVSKGKQAIKPIESVTKICMDQTKTVTAVFVKHSKPEAELRGLWVDAFHGGFKSKAEVNQLLRLAGECNYNAIFLEVLAYHDTGPGGHGAYWNSEIIPKASDIEDDFDPLGYAIKQAHARGLEVHPWLLPFSISISWPPSGNNTLIAHPEWTIVSHAACGKGVNAEGGKYMLDPGSPDVQNYVMSIVRELCSKYEIDGIHWDFIRYTSEKSGYPSDLNYKKSTLSRFKRLCGSDSIPKYCDDEWCGFRRRAITEFIRRAMVEVYKTKGPGGIRRHTASLPTWAPADSDFRETRPYYEVYSNWKTWQQFGYLDAAIPMVYFNQQKYPHAYRAWVDDCMSWANEYDRHTYIGVAMYLNDMDDGIGQMLYAQSRRAHGVCTYSYRVTNTGGRVWSDLYKRLSKEVFVGPKTLPGMPWRDPKVAKEGIVYGTVTHAETGLPIDDVIVEIKGVQKTRTDGNGFYVLTRVPASEKGVEHEVTMTLPNNHKSNWKTTVYRAGLTECSGAIH